MSAAPPSSGYRCNSIGSIHGAAPPGESSARPLLRIDGLTKRFGGSAAVDRLSLDIHAGEFLTLLGPSGSGKTTTLNMLAGFERPTRGEILLGGHPAPVPPYERNIGMVFQNYALFPHMTVAENVAFPLRRGAGARQIGERVRRALAMVRLEVYGERRPHNFPAASSASRSPAPWCSPAPSLVLMDEPLGALDKKLREQMRFELMLLQRRLGPDGRHRHARPERGADDVRPHRRDARGRLMQAGSPTHSTSEPHVALVADFIGDVNLLRATLTTTVAASRARWQVV